MIESIVCQLVICLSITGRCDSFQSIGGKFGAFPSDIISQILKLFDGRCDHSIHFPHYFCVDVIIAGPHLNHQIIERLRGKDLSSIQRQYKTTARLDVNNSGHILNYVIFIRLILQINEWLKPSRSRE